MYGTSYQPHILALDDSPDILSLYQELLGDERYHVSTGSYAAHDIDRIATMRPDLVILDLMRGDDQEHFRAIELFRMDSRIRETPVILCTGALRQIEPIRPQLQEMGVEVISKPFDIDAFLQVVARALAPAPCL